MKSKPEYRGDRRGFTGKEERYSRKKKGTEIVSLRSATTRREGERQSRNGTGGKEIGIILKKEKNQGNVKEKIRRK